MLPILRRAAPALLVAFVAPGGAGAASADPAPPPVKLAPFRVDDSSLNFGFGLSTWLEKTGRRHAMISRVDRASLAACAGLRVADRLVAVDGQPVATCDAAGLIKLFARTAPPGTTMTWKLVIERGLPARRSVVTLRAKAGATGPDLPAGAPLVITRLTPDERRR